MSLVKHLQDGGIPNGWTAIGLAWLAESHRRHSQNTKSTANSVPIGWNGSTPSLRSDWHRRWAAFIEDILETHRVNHH